MAAGRSGKGTGNHGRTDHVSTTPKHGEHAEQGGHGPLRRLKFDFSDKMLAELLTLQKRLNCPTRGEVIARALKILVWAEANHHHGNKIYVKRKNGETVEVQFPFLSSCTTPSQQ
jgi:hypothetical protein